MKDRNQIKSIQIGNAQEAVFNLSSGRLVAKAIKEENTLIISGATKLMVLPQSEYTVIITGLFFESETDETSDGEEKESDS